MDRGEDAMDQGMGERSRRDRRITVRCRKCGEALRVVEARAPDQRTTEATVCAACSEAAGERK